MPVQTVKPQTKHSQQIKLIEFARNNGFIITPQGWKKHLEQYSNLGHCPCEQSRPFCPCEEAVKEVKLFGHCKCSLFWRDYYVFMRQCYPDEFMEE